MGSSTNHLAGYGAEFYHWVVEMLTSSRQGYKRLMRSSSTKRRKVRVARLGKRRSFKMKRFPITIAKLRWRWVSPLALLAKLRDAYVNLLLAASSKITSPEGLVMGPFASHPNGIRVPFGHSPPKEYEKKILVELYKSMAQQQLIVPSTS